jgi:hypothetical protein
MLDPRDIIVSFDPLDSMLMLDPPDTIVLLDPLDSIVMLDTFDTTVLFDPLDPIVRFESLLGITDAAEAWNARQTSTIITSRILLYFILTPDFCLNRSLRFLNGLKVLRRGTGKQRMNIKNLLNPIPGFA